MTTFDPDFDPWADWGAEGSDEDWPRQVGCGPECDCLGDLPADRYRPVVEADVREDVL